MEFVSLSLSLFLSHLVNKKLQRGISRANCALVDFSRKKVTEDEHDHSHFLVDTPMYTFILPDLAMFPAEFRAFMEKDLLEMATMANLEHAGRFTGYIVGPAFLSLLCRLLRYILRLHLKGLSSKISMGVSWPSG